MPSSRKLHIASLGSSFAAGPNIAPQIQPFAAGRSGRNYEHLLAQKLDAEITDLSFSGSTLLNITEEPQTVWGEVFPPQIDGLPEDVDVITITSGGNDINYIGQMYHDAREASQPGMDKGYDGDDTWEHAPVPGRLNGLTQEDLNNRFIKAIDALHEKAPKARIYLVEYLALLGPDTGSRHDIPFDTWTIMYHSNGRIDYIEHAVWQLGVDQNGVSVSQYMRKASGIMPLGARNLGLGDMADHRRLCSIRI